MTRNWSTKYGGGAYRCTLNNCALTGNSALLGGGAYNCVLSNCTLSANAAGDYSSSVPAGAGACGCTLLNCILFLNMQSDGTGSAVNSDAASSTLIYCCTTTPFAGPGNISGDPLFVDAPGDLRLQPGAPCINAGNNAYARVPVDLDGNPRILFGTVDLGAYEFQGTRPPILVNDSKLWPPGSLPGGPNSSGFTVATSASGDRRKPLDQPRRLDCRGHP